MPQDNHAPTEAGMATPRSRVTRSIERREPRNVFGTRRTDNTPSRTSDAGELADLKKLLKAQEAAKQREQEKVVEAHRQLKAFETETTRVRSELKRTQDDLVNAKVDHSCDLRRATDREASLWNELVQVRAQAAKASDKASGYRKLAVFCLVLLMPVVSWAAVKYWPTAVEGNKARTETARVDLAALPTGEANTAPHDFTSDVRRLDQALNRFRHESAEEVLRGVHDANAARGVSVCSFEWNRGQVSLLFGNQPAAGISASMTQCADAVEQAAK